MIGKGETGREEEDAGAFFHPSAAARRALRRGSMPRLEAKIETTACGGAEVVSHSDNVVAILLLLDDMYIECVYVEGPEHGRVRLPPEIVRSGGWR